ncbi:acetoacetate decarboxylase [Enterobacter asburiae]|nr:acetoacetate decarboxylase [Enterobacter asburiae]
MSNPFNMPVRQGNTGYIPAPNIFTDREYFIITYETDAGALQKVLPPGLKVTEPLVKFEFMSMPDASGFGAFMEAGQAIPVHFNGQPGTYIHSMYLNSHPPVAGGREIWGFPKTIGNPALEVDGDHLLGTLDYGKTRVATGTMGFKHEPVDPDSVQKQLMEPGYLVKNIPHVDGSPAICQLVRYTMQDVKVKWAWKGPGTLELHPHVMAGVSLLPVLNVISATHFNADLTLPWGEVVIDYLK